MDQLTKLTGYIILYNLLNKTIFYDIKLFVFNSRASKVDAKMAILTAIWCFCFGRPTDAIVVVRAGAQRQRQCDWLSLKA